MSVYGKWYKEPLLSTLYVFGGFFSRGQGFCKPQTYEFSLLSEIPSGA